MLLVYTVNSEIFARIFISRITLKDIFSTLKIPHYGIIYLHQLTTVISPFREDFFSRSFPENKTFANISEFMSVLWNAQS